MSIRSRILLAFLLVTLLGSFLFTRWTANDVRRNYLESLEESMVDMANVLAASLPATADGLRPDVRGLESMMRAAGTRRPGAVIYDLEKRQVDLGVYVTDREGVVLYDSTSPKNAGKDFSRWNDVHLTLRGKYGARSTRIDPDDPATSILHVAAPVFHDGKLIGVLSVYKPSQFVAWFIQERRQHLIVTAAVVAVVVALLGALLSRWISTPVQRLADYAKAAREGRKVPLPKLGSGELAVLGKAFEETLAALEGKKYVENYVRNLTHELKSPLSGIAAAAESLEDADMPPERRTRFLGNIRFEADRARQMVDRLLRLSALESLDQLQERQNVELAALVRELRDNYLERVGGVKLELKLPAAPVVVTGDRALLYEALDNLLRNALDFAPASGAVITLGLRLDGAVAELSVSDNGPGVPAYALDRVFERFYSLPRPVSGKKSSGLGLSVVREIAVLHGGKAELRDQPPHGVRASISLPGDRGPRGAV